MAVVIVTVPYWKNKGEVLANVKAQKHIVLVPYKVYGDDSPLTEKVKEIVARHKPEDLDEPQFYSIIMLTREADGSVNIISGAPDVDQDFLDDLANITSPRHNDTDLNDDMLDMLRQFSTM